VRQDALSCYGYKRETSPNLKELMKTSRTYYNAYSTSSWTNPAHASLFTGLFPITHKTTQENWRLNENFTTLAEILALKGYINTGIVGNPMLAKEHGFNQGFLKYYQTWYDKYRVKEIKTKQHPAYFLFDRTIKKRNKEKPFFVFINFVEPHTPYDSSRQFHDEFISDPSLKVKHNFWPNYFLGKKTFTREEIQHLRELYDAEILYVDYVVGKIIALLKEEGLWNETLFIVTSDHGENIGDHNMMDHVFSLYESTIKIPLIIHYPKLFSGSKNYKPVQLPDIFTTITDMLGVTHTSQGSSLLKEIKTRDIFCSYNYPKQVLSGFRKTKGKPVLFKRYRRKLRSITSNNMKLIWGSDGRHELYDLKNDKGERNNLIDEPNYLKTKHYLFKALEQVRKKYKSERYSPTQERETIDKETIQQLKTLGYIQ